MPVERVKPDKAGPVDQTKSKEWRGAPKVSWPSAATVTVPLGASGAKSAAKQSAPARTTADNALPVRVSKSGGKSAPDERVSVAVLDRSATEALGVDGVVLSVRPHGKAKGKVDVEVDYDGFRHAYGGDWASRLRLHELPACALTTPEKKDCATPRELATTNDAKAGTLSATVGLAAADSATVLAATASAAGASGSFKATSLAPSSSWAAGGSNGGFTWSYDIATPDVPGDVSPQLKLGYSSQSIDGRTAATNNQGSIIGDGWSMEPGYIERQYIPCTDDKTGSNNTTAKVGDLCWKKDNAVLNLGGRSNQLIRDSASGEWHLESDDGTKIVKLTGSNNNGDNNGEYWQVTTPDGTRYSFGVNRAPGWSSGKEETNSVWTVPVFGNHSGEPCYNASFKDAWCQQAWRWNLDAVEDPHGDAMTYYWAKEKNHYGRNVDPNTGNSTATPYDRGGYLKRIDYGLRAGDHHGQPTAKVEFTYSERCLTNCGTFDSTNAKNWPDVPFDQYCAAGTNCKDRYSPSYWTRKRLTKVATSAWNGSAFKPVDSWALTHQFPSTGDGTSPALWLASITRSGHTGTGTVTLPSVTFKGQTLPNRVEGATTGGSPDPVPPMWRYRVYGITTETGGTIGVTYSPQDCKAGDIPSPSSNTRRCYPVKWSPPDSPGDNYEPYLDWFHSYVVTQVLETDNTGGAPAKQTDYTYLDGMAWAKSKDDEFTKAEHLTYGDRKGYSRVQVRTGAAPDKRTLKEYRYFRGVDGAAVKDSEGIAVSDKEAFSGMTREELTYNGDGGGLESATSYEPWLSAATATETRSGGLPSRKAYATGGKSEKTRIAVGTGWRRTQTTRTFDSTGHVLTESRLGDTAKSGDEQCTTTTYARNTGKNILDLPAEIKTVAKPCGTTPNLPTDLISTERRYYDNATSLTTAPVKGDVTRLEEQNAAGTGYLTTARHTYDQHGRELTDTDALGNTTTTAYTPAVNAPPTKMTETNALGHTTTTVYDPVRGIANAVTDANGKRTDAVHDGLGRVLKVWEPGWPKADHATQPSAQYTYKISKTQANAVTAKALQQDGSYRTTHTLYDGLLRERQTQALAHGSPHSVMTETHYDTRGWAWQTYSPYYAEIAPSTTLYTAKSVNQIPSAAQNLYDGLGRVTDALSLKKGDEQWRTRYVYGGDRTTVIPPKGGTATTTVIDARGRETELREYTDAARTAYQATTYTYGKYSAPTKVTDPAGNAWTYTFDQRGQQITADDPDKGTSRLTYDDAGRVTAVEDARKVTLTTVYDKLGRKTAVKNGTATLATWTYDTLAKGLPTSSTRQSGGAAYTTAVGGYNDRYQPTRTTLTVPSAAGGLAGTYSWSHGYDAETGAPEWTLHPAVGNVPSERVTTVYAEGRLPYKTTAGPITLVNSTQYDTFDRPVRTELGLLGKRVYKTRVYDEHTGRLVRQTTDRDLAPQRVDDTTYRYDPSGNVTGITTVSGQDASASTDRQCFTNDALGRLTKAWTAKSDCATAPSTTSVGGPDAYWLSYGYDKLGNRTSETDQLAGATTTYTHRAATTGLPHAVQQATVTGGAANGRVSSFQYDEAGNTTKRTIGTKVQDLTWDSEGHLATLSESGKTTSYLYDADGNRLIAKNADGSSVLTLPSGDQLRLAANGTKTGTRYYTHGGETVAVRTGSGISFLISDHQGTAMTAIAFTSLAVTRRKQLPFGKLRTAQSSAFGFRGFIGGTNDPTGLTHLGAREYDPTLGRFLSVDPIIDHGDPAQMNAYSYAHNNPLTKSDPDGLRPDGPVGGNGVADYYWAQDRGMTTGSYTKKSGKWVWNQAPKKDPVSQKKYKAYRANPAHYMIDDHNARARAASHTKALNKARADAQAAARAKEQAEQRRKDGIWGSIKKGNLRAAWDNTVHKAWDQRLGNSDWWKHYGVSKVITFAAAAGTFACIASAVCGAGLFIVGAGALFVAGLGAHMAVASPEERERGASQFVGKTAKSIGVGVVAGALCGRGPGGCFVLGPKPGTPLAGVGRMRLIPEATRIANQKVREYLF
ncbi:RHS repeat-associated core domain-containing protein [Streptomyces sp. MUM 203J]|uniref:RHS repeat domain-containing protein n=1 Tax=Streptomyces sp. MUM 203J TaxID=2791990 RepID=UPI0027E431D6|nr:RHS repeat-associated core domain-containing protein [Streptomyces sp. MUM 203J]